jgi:hypothetical protein
MDIDTFWELIRKSRRGATQDCEQITENLTARLEKLEPAEIISFDEHMGNLLDQAYRWDLWAVAYIINGGCSDDGFLDFRGWLIAQGKEFFEQVMADPETAARRVRDEEIECEAILGPWYDAYINKTGEEPPDNETLPDVSTSGELKGEPWKEPEFSDDLERLYPKLCKRFW